MTGGRSGAHVLLSTLREFGVRVCFANPGTTELAMVRALDDVPDIRPILGLFEGVCTGAADGYARISGIPAVTLLHLGPGLANGLANLHNARRAQSPVINIVGDHATWHLPYDAPLTSDIESLARPMSDSVIRIRSGETIAGDLQAAVLRAIGPPGKVVTVIAPSDLMEAPVRGPAHEVTSVAAVPRAPTVTETRLAEVVARLANVNRLVMLLGSDALNEHGQRAAASIAAATGARLLMESYPAVVAMGGDLPTLERLAYFPDDVRRQIGDALVLLVGARTPVSYFGYENQPSELVPPERLVELSRIDEDSVLALERLQACLPAKPRVTPDVPGTAAPARTSGFSPADVAEELVSQIPEGAIISLEGATCGGPYIQRAHRARRHRVMTNTGGAIGQGLPCALGAAVAKPDSRIICLQSDGSAQYTVQSLWTMVRERLNISVIICANHRYGILQTELRRTGADIDRPAMERMTRLDSPRIDWVALARGYGMPGVRASTSEEFQVALRRSLEAAGPSLIQVDLP